MPRRVHQPLEDEEFEFILRMSKGPVLLYFSGTWPKAIEVCRAIDLVVGRITEEYANLLTAVKIDITRCPVATKRYDVTGAPSVVLLKEGEVVARSAGPMTHTEFRKFLTTHL
ncbi:thioredoxin [Streptomyces roseoverticillatus]|uniref:thioredoxin family protein n=1 Tax=Streptomyces roseoverticillatus TaxID=66429 RepID=UPI001F478B9E|nr:thioredoxin family protein [Streptomyces roseoverticillatus]MCF3105932.1 thioredoxin [Streptomyces roseoverticillatus]